MASAPLIKNGISYVTAKAAAPSAGISADYITKLCRKGEVNAVLVGTTWYVDEASLAQFVARKEAAKKVQAELNAQQLKEVASRAQAAKPEQPPARIHRSARINPAYAFSMATIVLLIAMSAGTFALSTPTQQSQLLAAAAATLPTPIQKTIDRTASAVFDFFCPFISDCGAATGFASAPTATTTRTLASQRPATFATTSRTLDEVRPPQQPMVIERVVERTATIIQGAPSGITGALLDARFAALETYLIGRIDVLAYQGDRQAESLADSLADGIGGGGFDDIDITDSTFTGGSISGASISGASLSGTTFSGETDFTSLTVTVATSTNASSTNLYVSSSFGFGTDTGLLRNDAGTVSTFAHGSNGQVLKIVGGALAWGTDLTGGGGGGSSFFASTSDNLAIYPADPSHVVILGESATSTTGNILEVSGNSLFRGAATSYGLLTSPRFTATSSIASVFPYASTTALSAIAICLSADCISSWPTDTSFSTTSADFWKTTSNFFSTTSADAWQLTRNFFSTTSASYFLSQNQSAAFSSTSANYFIHSSTTVPRLYSSNVWTGGNIFANATTTYATTTNLFVTDTFAGAGLSACHASGDKLVYNANTKQFECGSDAGAGGGITSLRAQHSGSQSGSAQVFATSSDTNLQLTITSSGDTHTFTPVWSGVLAVSRGGTGIGSAPTYGQVLVGDGLGGYVLSATSSLGLSSFSTTSADSWKDARNFFASSSADYFVHSSSTIPKVYTANAFSALQSFQSASTTSFSATYASSTQGVFGSLSVGTFTGFLKATAGAIATAAIDLASDVTGILGVARGGTGWAAVEAGSILYGNGSSALATTTAGTSGQVLALVGNVPTWVATSTLATISGTLEVSKGGTGATSFSYGLVLSPGGTAALTNIATSSLGLLTTHVAEGSNLYYTDGRVQTYLDGIDKGYFFATTSADTWKLTRDFFSTTSAQYFVHSSTTIPKLYTANDFTALQSFANASTTILSADTLCVASDCRTSWPTSGSSFAYPFPSNATTTTLTFSNGHLSLASTTIGNGSQAGGLTISGGATTTGRLNVGVSSLGASAALFVSNSLGATNVLQLGENLSHAFTISSGGNWQQGGNGGAGGGTALDFGMNAVTVSSGGTYMLINPQTADDSSNLFLAREGASSNYFAIKGSGDVGIGTTSPQYRLTAFSNTAPQLSLSGGAGIAQWAFRNAGGNFYLASTTVGGTATTSTAAFSIVGPTTTLSTRLEVRGSRLFVGRSNSSNDVSAAISVPSSIDEAYYLNFGTSAGFALSVSSNGGILQRAASVGSGVGVNFGANTSSTVSSGGTYFRINPSSVDAAGYAFDVLSGTSNYFNVTGAGRVGVGTTTPFAKLSVQATAAQTNPIFEVASSSNATKFLSVSSTGFGTTTLAGLNINGQATSTSNVGFNLTAGCYAINDTCISGSSDASFSYPFPQNGTTSSLMLLASTTIGGGTPMTGLTVSGGATTTGRAYFGGNVGIGTNNTPYPLGVVGNTDEQAVGPVVIASSGNGNIGTALTLDATSNSGGHKYSFISTGTGAAPGAGSFAFYDGTMDIYRMIISPAGNVGIGTTSPGTKLTLHNGNFTFTDTDVSHGMTILNAADAYGAIFPISDTDGGLKVRGISDTDAQGLSLQGIIGATNPTDSTAAIRLETYRNDGGGSVTSLASAETALQVMNFTAPLMTILGGGNLGLGSTTPWKTLSVVGTMSVNGLTLNTGAASASLCLSSSNEVTRNTDNESCITSSARYKHDIQSLIGTTTLETLLALRPVSFEYNETPGVRYGLIAEEVDTIDPTLVGYDDEGKPNSVRYTSVIPLLIQAIQDIANITDLFMENLIAFLGDTQNGIADLFAKHLHAENITAHRAQFNELCVGQVCVTEAQFMAVFGQAAGDAIPISAPSPTSNDNEPPAQATQTDGSVATSSQSDLTDSEQAPHANWTSEQQPANDDQPAASGANAETNSNTPSPAPANDNPQPQSAEAVGS